MELYFEAVEARRIMTSRDHDPGSRFLFCCMPRDGRGGHGAVGKQDFVSVSGQYFGGGLSEFVGEKTAVITDHHAFAGGSSLFTREIIGSGLGH